MHEKNLVSILKKEKKYRSKKKVMLHSCVSGKPWLDLGYF